MIASNEAGEMREKLRAVEDRLSIYKYIYLNVYFTIMAPVRQLIFQCRWRNPKIHQSF
jgi:hypothetical protein